MAEYFGTTCLMRWAQGEWAMTRCSFFDFSRLASAIAKVICAVDHLEWEPDMVETAYRSASMVSRVQG